MKVALLIKNSPPPLINNAPPKNAVQFLNIVFLIACYKINPPLDS